MVTSIQLGNVSQQNGRTVISGSSSGGLDTEALLKALTEARRLPAVQLEERIDQNTKISAAYSELEDILIRFRDAADFLRNPPGVGNEADNIFQYRNATISNSGAQAGSNYLAVTVEPGAELSNYAVKVDQLATFNVKLTNTFTLADTSGDGQVTSADAAVGAALPFAAGTYAFGASGVNVTLNNGDTLSQVAAKINAVSSQSKVAATIVQVSPGNFRLSLKTTETGAAQNYASPVFNVTYAQETNAVDAQLTIDGTTVTRARNNISDVIDGVTFSLKQATPLTDTLSVGVGADTELVKNAIFSFVDSYNEFRIFAAKQLEVGDDGTPTDEALLSSSSTLRTALSRVNTEVTQIIDGITTGPNQLSQIGLTFNDFPGDDETPLVRNILTIDESALDSALASDFDGVRRVFEFDFTSTDPDLTVFSRTNGLNATAISLNIDQTNGVYEATFDNGGGPVTIALDATAISSGGVVLRGQDGTALQGLVLIYANNGDAVVDLDLSQGIGDRVFNALDDLLNEESGLVKTELETISETNIRLEDEIRRIDDVVERYREQLLQQFSALEAAIAAANTLLQSLKAQSDARVAAGS